MLGFFPTPYPEETLFSLVGRFQRTMNWTPLMLREYWGVLTWNPHIQQNIGWLKQNLPAGHPLQQEQIVQTRTVYRALVLGWDKDSADAVVDQLECGRQPWKYRWRMQESYKRLQSCPACRKHQLETYGECYWMRLHQVLTVTACPIHGCRLERTPYKTVTPHKTMLLTEEPSETKEAEPWEIKHAERCARVLEGEVLDAAVWRTNLGEKLAEMGHAIKIRTSYWLSEPRVRSALKKLNGRVCTDAGIKLNQRSILPNIRRGLSGASFERLLLLMCMTDSSVESLNAKRDPQRTTFPCRNPLAPCFLKETITKPKHRGNQLAYRCPNCRYEYLIKKEDREINSPENMPKVRVSSLGPVWAKEFSVLWQNKRLPDCEIMRKIGFARGRFHLEGKRLGLAPRSKFKTSIGILGISAKRKRKNGNRQC